MCRREEDELPAAVGVPMDLGRGIESVACDDDRGHVAGATALDGDASYARAREAEEGGQRFRRMLFDEGQDRRDMVDVEVCVKRGEDEVGGDARGVGGGVELVQKARGEGIYGVSKNRAKG